MPPKPTPKYRIYIEVVVLKPQNAVELTSNEMLAIPCHYLMCQEAEKRMLVVDYTPGTTTTREQVIAVHLTAYGRKHKVVSHKVYDELPALL